MEEDFRMELEQPPLLEGRMMERMAVEGEELVPEKRLMVD